MIVNHASTSGYKTSQTGDLRQSHRKCHSKCCPDIRRARDGQVVSMSRGPSGSSRLWGPPRPGLFLNSTGDRRTFLLGKCACISQQNWATERMPISAQQKDNVGIMSTQGTLAGPNGLSGTELVEQRARSINDTASRGYSAARQH